MAWITDSLRSAIEACNPFARRGQPALPNTFSHQLAILAYLQSGMLRKVISIPADDRVREWRDWQADKKQIEAIEAEERRLGLRAKVKHAEVLRGIGGGALVIITPGSHAEPLAPDSIARGGLVAINVVSRWQLTAKDWVQDLASPDYGNPRMFSMQGERGTHDIHPSRVVCFRGDPLPRGYAIADEEAFWGDSRLLRVFTEVQRSDETQAWFAALVRKAKLTRVGIPNLTDLVSTTDGNTQLMSRIQLMAEGENILNATVFDAGAGESNPGEQITDYEITWTGIPAVMDAFDQRVAAVADIPFTRLMGRSPAGMNATGEHDLQNWNKMVASGQNLELRPCLEMLDPILLRSAGVTAPDVTWRFAPLWTPTEKEEADTFKTTMDAVEKLQMTGAIPDVAFAKGLQNLLAEREYIPGLDQALAEVPESERFGIQREDDPDPEEGGDPASAGEGGSDDPPRRAANDLWFFADATPRPLYVQRKLLNASDLVAWAKDQGLETTLPASDMHVTVLYSRKPVDPMKMGESWASEADGGLTVKPGGPRAIERFGEGALVLQFASWSLISRHNEMIQAGGSHDYDEYLPHVTITYSVPDGFDLESVKPYAGELRFGPELFEPLDLDWKTKIREL